MGTPQESTRRGWLLPSARQWLWGVALSGLGYLLWQEYAANRVRERLWDTSASPTDLIRAADHWSRQGAPAVPALIEALSNENPQTRRYAVMSLWRMGSPARPAVPALLRALRDEHPFVRREAVCALSVLDGKSDSTIAAIAELLSDPDPSVQRETVTVLSGQGEAALPLAQARLTHSSPVARRLGMELMANVIQDQSEVARLAQPLTEDPDAQVQTQAIRLVFRAGAATEEQVVRWLSHDEEPVRVLAIRAMHRMVPPRKAIRPLIGCIKRGPMPQAVECLRQFGTDAAEAVPALLEALETASLWEKVQLLGALQTVGCDATTLSDRCYEFVLNNEGHVASPVLIILKSVDPERMQREIDRRLEQLRVAADDQATILKLSETFRFLPAEEIEAARPGFEPLLFADNPAIRQAALTIVGAAKSERSVPALARVLEGADIDEQIWQLGRIIEAIGLPRGEALRQPLLRCIRERQSSRDEPRFSDVSRQVLMLTAARIGIRDQVFLDYLFLVAEGRSMPLREGALQAFGCIGGGDDRVLNVFLKSLDSANPAVRFTTAEQILEAVGARPEVAEGLIPLLSDPEPRIRALAAITLARMESKALVAIGPLRDALAKPENDVAIQHPLSTGWKPLPQSARIVIPDFNESNSVSVAIEGAIKHIESFRAGTDD